MDRAVLQPESAGKTTLFRTIAGVLKPGSGAVEFNGIPIYQMPWYR
ncbi:MAG: hypothetical protein R6U41_10060 [Desulfosalsimonas sp.]